MQKLLCATLLCIFFIIIANIIIIMYNGIWRIFHNINTKNAIDGQEFTLHYLLSPWKRREKIKDAKEYIIMYWNYFCRQYFRLYHLPRYILIVNLFYIQILCIASALYLCNFNNIIVSFIIFNFSHMLAKFTVYLISNIRWYEKI